MTGSLVYLDSSVIVKLAVREPEFPALSDWLARLAFDHAAIKPYQIG